MIDVSTRAHPDDFALADTDEFDNCLGADLRARIKRELEPGESVIWAACSSMPPFRLGTGFLCAGAIAVVFIVSGIGVASRVSQPGPRADFLPAAMILLCLGAIFAIGMIGNLITREGDRRRKGGVCNAVTDRRAIVWSPETERNAIRVQSIARGQVAHLTCIERPDGSGTLEFSLAGNAFDYHHRLAFDNIPEVRRVEQLVRNSLMTSEPST